MIVNSVCLNVMTGKYFLLYTSLTGVLLGTFGINGFSLTLVTVKHYLNTLSHGGYSFALT